MRTLTKQERQSLDAALTAMMAQRKHVDQVKRDYLNIEIGRLQKAIVFIKLQQAFIAKTLEPQNAADNSSRQPGVGEVAQGALKDQAGAISGWAACCHACKSVVV